MSRVLSVRPHQLFAKLDNASANTFVNLLVPSLNGGVGYGSPDFLETICLMALVKMRAPKRIFEFGTFTGHTTAQLAANAPLAEVVTLDIPSEELAALSPVNTGNQGQAEDNDLREISSRISGIVIDRAATEPWHSHIRRLRQNSLTLDVAVQGFSQSFDFIFVDAGHDYDSVRNDTEKAYEMAGPGAMIVWHDYGSRTHPDVKRYLDELSETRSLYHIGNTTLAFWWDGFLPA